MNIIYNHPVTEKDLELFKLIEEFVNTHLNDKSLFYRITVNLYENGNKRNALLKPAGVFHLCKDHSKTKISINNYILRVRADSLVRHNDPVFKDCEKLRYQVIFHELAHLVITYNDPEKMQTESIPNIRVLNQKEEDMADKMANEFLASKGILNLKGVDGNAV